MTCQVCGRDLVGVAVTFPPRDTRPGIATCGRSSCQLVGMAHAHPLIPAERAAFRAQLAKAVL